VDCTPTQISNVQSNNIGPYSATVTFSTDEQANGAVRYGQTCGALTETAAESGYDTSHTVVLTGLTESTTYSYAVDADDEAGNTSTDDNGGICHTLETPDRPDYFTELFGSDNDLDYLTLTFTPDGSNDFYSGCIESIADLPVDPSGGTTIILSDESYAIMPLSDGANVGLYGVIYDTFYVDSNGYIAFTADNSTWSESLEEHFRIPRISALFDDLDPSSLGTVSWKQLTDRAVVTWQDIPFYGGSGSNTFQIEMHFDGTIVISYLAIDSTGGLAGLSEGNGLSADYYKSDLSAMEPCEPTCNNDIDCNDGNECTTNTCHNPGTSDAYCEKSWPICSGGESDGCCGPDCSWLDDADCQECGDGYCAGEANGENCISCLSDCFIGNGASCGNGVCETADGEDCISCPDDCNGKLGGKPSRRYCCGSDPTQYGVSCDDGRCWAGDNTCTGELAVQSCCGDGFCEGDEHSYNCEIDCSAPPYCGDGNCDGGEDQCSCSQDCGTPPLTETNCADGIDNDCDGFTDGADDDCKCLPRREPCSSDSDCCSNRCHRGTCK
jgi:chitodextrinase